MNIFLRVFYIICGLVMIGTGIWCRMMDASLIPYMVSFVLAGILFIFYAIPLWKNKGEEYEKKTKKVIILAGSILAGIILLLSLAGADNSSSSSTSYPSSTYVPNPDKPYYGMSERQISRTKLGMYDKYMKDKVFDGEYDYIWEDSNGKMLFKARVKKGVVVGISEFSGSKSDKPASTKTPVTSSVGKTSKPAATSKPKTSKSVAGYYSPEDFYYDYPDDFFDFEEAEEYYYAHGGF